MTEALVTSLLKNGAPWGILCAVLLVIIIQLWRRHQQLAEKVFEIGMASMKMGERTVLALQEFREELRDFRRHSGGPPGPS